MIWSVHSSRCEAQLLCWYHTQDSVTITYPDVVARTCGVSEECVTHTPEHDDTPTSENGNTRLWLSSVSTAAGLIESAAASVAVTPKKNFKKETVCVVR